MAQVGDTVRFLNSVGGGVISRIAGNLAYVEDSDGFETPVLLRECVVVAKAAAAVETPAPATSGTKKVSGQYSMPAPVPVREPEVPVLDVSETDGGDTMNVVLGFEPQDLRRLSGTVYECSLVNDSNYYLYFTLMAREDKDGAGADEGWTTVYSGMVEPNIQVLAGEYSGEEVGRFDRLTVQYVAFKKDKPFALKKPASVNINVDTTKFFKLHCFRDNVYFDNPVLAFDIVRDDKPVGERPVDPRALEEAMKEKIKSDRRPVRRRIATPKTDPRTPMVVDLHIHELIDSTSGLSNADMLNLQIDKFREVMDANLRHKGRRIVFIHGKGEGVLRNALMKELKHRYKGHDVQDASFAEYGYGATQVTI